MYEESVSLPYSSTPLKVSAVLNGFLEHVARDRVLKKQHAPAVCGHLLSQWGRLASWWGPRGSTDQRLGAVNLLRKMLALEPKV